ncbi:sensor histidine kinase [Blastococcus sp. SYSU D00813]
MGWSRPGRRAGSSRLALRRELVAFVAIALVVLFVVAALTYALAGRIAADSARREAEDAAERLARILVAPLIGNVLAGEAEDRRDLDQILDIRMSDGSVTEVLVWDDEGQVVYATDPAKEGLRVSPSPELQAAIDGRTASDIEEESEGDETSHRGRQLEVYVPMDAAGQRLVFEAYFDGARVDEDAALLRRRAVPLALGALVVLQLLQFPIAASMGRRLTRQQAAQTEMARRHLAASERERRAIAADVHDGPVQDLAGVSYGLSALRSHLQERQQASLDRMVVALRTAVASLRRLMVDIYPPDLSGPGLPTALEDLAGRVRTEGLDVRVQAEPLPEMTSDSAAVLYRTAKEALANVVKHARARTAVIRLEAADGPAGPAVRLVVEDDGVGLPEGGAVSGDGHLGLRLLRERLEAAGGTVALRNGEDGGAVVDAVLPVDGASPPSPGNGARPS